MFKFLSFPKNSADYLNSVWVVWVVSWRPCNVWWVRWWQQYFLYQFTKSKNEFSLKNTLCWKKDKCLSPFYPSFCVTTLKWDEFEGTFFPFYDKKVIRCKCTHFNSIAFKIEAIGHSTFCFLSISLIQSMSPKMISPKMNFHLFK